MESTGAAVAACISGRSDEGAAFVGNRQQDSRGSARPLSVVSILAILVVGLLHAQWVGECEATEAPWVLGAWRAVGDQTCGDTAFMPDGSPQCLEPQRRAARAVSHDARLPPRCSEASSWEGGHRRLELA